MALLDDTDGLLPGLLPAAWRGGSFWLINSSHSVGRRIHAVLYPGLDLKTHDDTGPLDGPFRISGLVIGDDYIAQARALAAKFRQPGPATLMHPWWGSVRCVLIRPAQIDFDVQELRVARIDAEFDPLQSGGLTTLAGTLSGVLSALSGMSVAGTGLAALALAASPMAFSLYSRGVTATESALGVAGAWAGRSRRSAALLPAVSAARTQFQVAAGTTGRAQAAPLLAAVSGTGEIGLGLQAIEGGVAANTSGGAALPIVTTLAGLDPQSTTLDLDGLAGGSEEETDDSILARLLQVIREPGHGGAAFDYPVWVQSEFAACKVKVIPSWVRPGSLAVIVAMGTADAPRVPTAPEIAAIAAHLEALRPVTAEVIVLAYLPLVQPFTIQLAPDTVANRAAVAAAIADHFAREAQIGEPMPYSRISEAISAASGEYSHELTVPAGAIVPAPRELPLPGAITWVAP